MPRHVLRPLPRAFVSHREPPGLDDKGIWETLDRVQVLGEDGEGHTGCVNALSWSEDGRILLSGSDDKKICIWTPDDSSSSSSSPHPMKLADIIGTGHKANIFSARFLPNASSPTIVSCAGDREVRVFDVDRLGRSDMGRGAGRGRDDLWGQNGPGVTVLRCHRDRTKRIATENSPFLFLTVSEDGTVRQHDLRRPHRCPSECPEPLFRAPRGVDLYSLSVSNVTPHMFAVAGRTDCAFICDRRMVERQNPTWGKNIVGSGQVHCVRRLGLPEEEWDKVTPEGGRRWGEERHITSVKMSGENADEVIVSFARHSTSLFSTFDSPYSPSAKAPNASPTLSTKSLKSPQTGSKVAESSVQPAELPEKDDKGKEGRESDSNLKKKKSHLLGKRKQSQLSTKHDGSEPAIRLRSNGNGSPSSSQREETVQIADLDQETVANRVGVGDDLHGLDEVSLELCDESRSSNGRSDSTADQDESTAGPSSIGNSIEPFERGNDKQKLDFEMEDPSPQREWASLLSSDMDTFEHMRSSSNTPALACNTSQNVANEDGDEEPVSLADMEIHELFGLDVQDDEENGEDDFAEEDDFMEYDEDAFDLVEDRDNDDDDEDEDMDVDSLLADPRSAATEFGCVDLIYPRRSFRGAKNVETVKDCNFLGHRSDKVCSGSDDGNFFVWDKDTGKLEGIWEGDGSVVNMIEQHPTLPLVAVSGIDHTVKMFSPTPIRPETSFLRTHLQDRIIRANTSPARFLTGSSFGRMSMLNFLASRGMLTGAINGGPEEGEEMGTAADVIEQCQTQ